MVFGWRCLAHFASLTLHACIPAAAGHLFISSQYISQYSISRPSGPWACKDTYHAHTYLEAGPCPYTWVAPTTIARAKF
jgi:hypothetical protein